MKFYQPQRYGAKPEDHIFGSESLWQESALSDVVDLNDPDFRYITDAITLMRLAGMDVADPAVLRLAVDAGHRKAASVRDDSELLGHATEDHDWRTAVDGADRVTLPGYCGPPVVVYYMRLGNRCKIGYTNNLSRRMREIGPEELLVTEPGGSITEALRHVQFAHLRVVGEWFRYEGSLIEHIDRLRAA